MKKIVTQPFTEKNCLLSCFFLLRSRRRSVLDCHLSVNQLNPDCLTVKMLLESGDLFPVINEAVDIPWTRRKNLIANFLYRGAVNFQTLVYDSNVGDIAPLSMYFNPRKWTVQDLNQKFGQVADEDDRSETSSNLTIGP